MEIKTIMQEYEAMSVPAIYSQKFGIFFSANVHTDKQDEITDLWGVQNDLSEGQYLGLPSLIGRSKRLFSIS